MVAPAGINAVSGPDRTKGGGSFFRVFQSFIFIIKNISGNAHQIRLLGINCIYKKFCIFFSDAVAKMNICKQDDLKGISSFHLLIYFHIISFCLKIPLI